MARRKRYRAVCADYRTGKVLADLPDFEADSLRLAFDHAAKVARDAHPRRNIPDVSVKLKFLGYVRGPAA